MRRDDLLEGLTALGSRRMRAEIFFERFEGDAGEFFYWRACRGMHFAIYFFEASHGVESAFRGIAGLVGERDAIAIGFLLLFFRVAGFVEHLDGSAELIDAFEAQLAAG